jgi:hypothetical protein
LGLEEMVRVKYLDVDRWPRMKKVWWYGYGQSFTRQMEAFVDLQFARRWGTRLRALKTAAMAARRKL